MIRCVVYAIEFYMSETATLLINYF